VIHFSLFFFLFFVCIHLYSCHAEAGSFWCHQAVRGHEWFGLSLVALDTIAKYSMSQSVPA
jgi:hypothetical protein